ncbi:hypothetical protein L5515_003284 [Caenorhabditis briggsae]|uniref:Uncharacterized protein n=1 Tax=Caenorhabditis briggsae TaxID=6238 RepID=A0AAE9EK49_CAEBR|nr:hypothetical protein L5515_003284 [Caenorhabditis briggsae]
MQALQNRLEQLENATGSEMWEILKASESDLRQDLSQLNLLKEDKEKHIKKALEEIKSKKEDLKAQRSTIESLKIQYKEHIEAVKREFEGNGLDMQKVIGIFQKILKDSLSEKKATVIATVDSTVITSKSTWQDLKTPVKSIISTISDLDLISPGNHQKSIDNLVQISISHLENLCIDMIDKERGGDADFEWILESGKNWARNLKLVLEKGVETMGTLKIEQKSGFSAIFDAKFVEFIGNLTRRFLKMNIKDPLIFSKMSILLRRFEENCEFDLSNSDIFEPIYEPEFISKWILFEVELYTVAMNRVLSCSSNCFLPLESISIGNPKNSQWAAEITVFVEQWITRLDSNIQNFGNLEIQMTFYECIHALLSDLCSRIHSISKRLESEATWSNDVYLVMNSIWELKRIVKTQTLTWPITSFELERVYENEWDRLCGMIIDYLNEDLLDRLEISICSNYGDEKIKTMNSTFYHILKCLNNVTIKASRPSRSVLMNLLVEELFKNLQMRFEKWKSVCSMTVLGHFYNQIYSNLVPELDNLEKEGHWTRGNPARSEMCRLDALMKVAANCDTSGELVRTAFRSIDEEQADRFSIDLCVQMSLILLMGIPGAGKSSLRRRLCSAHPDLIESTSFGDFRRQMRSAVDLSAREIRKSFEREFQICAIPRQKFYLIEDIFHLKSMRRKFRKIAKNRLLEFGVVFLECTSSEAIRRDSRRRSDERQGETTILRIFEALEVPENSEEKSIILGQEEAENIDFWEILRRLGIGNETPSEENSELANKSVKFPKKNLTPSESSLEQIDVSTRRCVSELIQNDRSIDGRRMALARKILIDNLKKRPDIEILSNCNLKRELICIYKKMDA